MTARNEKRPWLAVLLAFLYPGLGHAYLREWLRALMWFALAMTGSTLLIPESAVPDEFSVGAMTTAAQSIPIWTALAILSITFFAMIDAYWMAKRRNRETAVDEGTTCPSCGKDVDPDLDFCHWCTARLPTAEEPRAETES